MRKCVAIAPHLPGCIVLQDEVPSFDLNKIPIYALDRPMISRHSCLGWFFSTPDRILSAGHRRLPLLIRNDSRLSWISHKRCKASQMEYESRARQSRMRDNRCRASEAKDGRTIHEHRTDLVRYTSNGLPDANTCHRQGPTGLSTLH